MQPHSMKSYILFSAFPFPTVFTESKLYIERYFALVTDPGDVRLCIQIRIDLCLTTTFADAVWKGIAIVFLHNQFCHAMEDQISTSMYLVNIFPK